LPPSATSRRERAPDIASDSNFKQPITVIASESEAIQSHKARMDCFVAFAPRNDVKTHFRDLAAILPEFCYQHPLSENQRAQGMPGAQRARSLACKIKSTRA
jgi:hypothetical protein